MATSRDERGLMNCTLALLAFSVTGKPVLTFDFLQFCMYV